MFWGGQLARLPRIFEETLLPANVTGNCCFPLSPGSGYGSVGGKWDEQLFEDDCVYRLPPCLDHRLWMVIVLIEMELYYASTARTALPLSKAAGMGKNIPEQFPLH